MKDSIIGRLKTLCRNGSKKKMAIAAADDLYVLEVASQAIHEQLVDPILIGNKAVIENICLIHKLPLDKCMVIDAPNPEVATEIAATLVTEKSADMIMKGHIESRPFMKIILDKKYCFRLEGIRMSSIALMEIEQLNKTIWITDPSFVPFPDIAMKCQLIENALPIMNRLGISHPKVALICATETVNPQMQATVDAKDIQDMNICGKISGCTVAGPISFDLAISRRAAEIKSYQNPVGGNADLFVMPSLETGNVLCKTLTYCSNVVSAGIIAGTGAPIVFASRAESMEGKLNTIAVASVLAG